MQIETDLTKEQTHYLIDLLNEDFRKMRLAKEDLAKNFFVNRQCRKHRTMTMTHLDIEMEENQKLVHKLDDHLTDIKRGRKLNGLFFTESSSRA